MVAFPGVKAAFVPLFVCFRNFDKLPDVPGLPPRPSVNRQVLSEVCVWRRKRRP